MAPVDPNVIEDFESGATGVFTAGAGTTFQVVTHNDDIPAIDGTFSGHTSGDGAGTGGSVGDGISDQVVFFTFVVEPGVYNVSIDIQAIADVQPTVSADASFDPNGVLVGHSFQPAEFVQVVAYEWASPVFTLTAKNVDASGGIISGTLNLDGGFRWLFDNLRAKRLARPTTGATPGALRAVPSSVSTQPDQHVIIKGIRTNDVVASFGGDGMPIEFAVNASDSVVVRLHESAPGREEVSILLSDGTVVSTAVERWTTPGRVYQALARMERNLNEIAAEIRSWPMRGLAERHLANSLAMGLREQVARSTRDAANARIPVSEAASEMVSWLRALLDGSHKLAPGLVMEFLALTVVDAVEPALHAIELEDPSRDCPACKITLTGVSVRTRIDKRNLGNGFDEAVGFTNPDGSAAENNSMYLELSGSWVTDEWSTPHMVGFGVTIVFDAILPAGTTKDGIGLPDFAAHLFLFVRPETTDREPVQACSLGSNRLALGFGLDVMKSMAKRVAEQEGYVLPEGATMHFREDAVGQIENFPWTLTARARLYCPHETGVINHDIEGFLSWEPNGQGWFVQQNPTEF